MSSQEEDRILRLRNITYTRLIRDTGNSCSLTDYERQNYLDLLGAARMKEVEDEASCLAGAEDAKESIGRPKCRYGRDCRTGRDGDGKKCRFLHPEKRFILRKTLVKELDRLLETRGIRKLRGDKGGDGTGCGTIGPLSAEGSASLTQGLRERPKNLERGRNRSADSTGSVERARSGSPRDRSADSSRSSEWGGTSSPRNKSAHSSRRGERAISPRDKSSDSSGRRERSGERCSRNSQDKGTADSSGRRGRSGERYRLSKSPRSGGGTHSSGRRERSVQRGGSKSPRRRTVEAERTGGAKGGSDASGSGSSSRRPIHLR